MGNLAILVGADKGFGGYFSGARQTGKARLCTMIPIELLVGLTTLEEPSRGKEPTL